MLKFLQGKHIIWKKMCVILWEPPNALTFYVLRTFIDRQHCTDQCYNEYIMEQGYIHHMRGGCK